MLAIRRKKRPLPGFKFRTILPGPERRRFPKRYEYELIFQNENTSDSGCLTLWNVRGGRMTYQVALERTEEGKLQWHCTCADAVYRERECKHVRGVIEVRRDPVTVPRLQQAS